MGINLVDAAVLTIRLLLATVFLVAGVSKLLDRRGTRKAMVDFGLPAALVAPISVLLPLAELTVAAALLPTISAWWGAAGALALLSLFLGTIGLNLARGRRPDCRCFGQIAAGPIGRVTLIRNGVLAALASFVLWQGWVQPGPDVLVWLGELLSSSPLAIVGLVVLGLVVAETALLFQVLAQNGRLMLRLETVEQWIAEAETEAESDLGAASRAPVAPAPGLPVGSPAPAFALPGLYGETLTLEALRAPGRPLLLTFSDPYCGPCNALMPDLGRWQR